MSTYCPESPTRVSQRSFLARAPGATGEAELSRQPAGRTIHFPSTFLIQEPTGVFRQEPRRLSEQFYHGLGCALAKDERAHQHGEGAPGLQAAPAIQHTWLCGWQYAVPDGADGPVLAN